MDSTKLKGFFILLVNYLCINQLTLKWKVTCTILI